MTNRNLRLKLLFVLVTGWLFVGAACDTFLKAEGTISLKGSLSEIHEGKKMLGVWAIKAEEQSENTAMDGGDICESLGQTCSVVIQSIDVSFIVQEDNTAVLEANPNDTVINGQNEYRFKLSNIYGPGEKRRFDVNFIGAFIDVDGNGKWESVEPFGWAVENPLTRGCVNRRSSDHVNCTQLNIPIE